MTDEPKRLYLDGISGKDKARRAFWRVIWTLFFVTTPVPIFGKWRVFLLRLFGARIGVGCRIEPTCRIWAPWNLTMGNYSCLGPGVDCYNVTALSMADYVTVSQRSFLCCASHDISQLKLPLTFAPIKLERYSWVAAEAYVGPGVIIKEGAVLGARGVATSDLEAWTVNVGVPAHCIKTRRIQR